MDTVEPTRPRAVILIVDDDTGIQDLLRLGLEGVGFRVDLVGDGYSAIEVARHRRPDLVILDLNLPLISGEHVARGLQSLGGPPIPMVVISGDPQADERTHGLPAVAWFAKPFDLDELVGLVRTLVPVASPVPVDERPPGVSVQTAEPEPA